MGRVRGLKQVTQGSGTVGKFEKYRKVRSLAENNKGYEWFPKNSRYQTLQQLTA